MPRYRSWDLSRFFCHVVSFVIELLNLIKERISRASASGVYMPLSCFALRQTASFLLSTASALRSFLLLMVGTSAGFTTMLCIPNSVNLSCIQNPQKPASYTECSTPRPDSSLSRSCAVLSDLHPGCTSSRLTSPTILSPTNSSNGHPILCRCFVL